MWESKRLANLIALSLFAVTALAFYAEPTKLNAIWPNILTYETSGLKCANDSCELGVRIRNGGWATQRDLRFELPVFSKDHRRIFSNRAYKVLTDTTTKTLDLGILHPGLQRYVTLYYPRDVEKERFDQFFLEIYSAEAHANYTGRDDPFAISFPWWWWTMVALLAFLIVFGALARIFETPKQRYVRLLFERDHNLKVYLKAKSALVDNAKQLTETPPAVADEAERGMDRGFKFTRPKSRRRADKPATGLASDVGAN